MCHLFPLSHHGDEPLFDCGGSFRRAQTKGECFMQSVTFCNEIFSLLAELFPLLLKFFEFLRLQCANDIKSRLVLKFLKVHRSTPSGVMHGWDFSPISLINSGMLIGLARTGHPWMRRPAFASAFVTRAVRKIIGVLCNSGSASICVATSPPSLCGIIMSSKTRSGLKFRAL